jgi:LmbE family N-acetylglucosaminyl deacetylase
MPADILYLSPHLDDAALSCGGQIVQHTAAGRQALIVTVMAGDPPHDDTNDYVRSLHTRWALESDAAARRRAEDVAACAVLGAGALHLSVPDCIYRTDPATGRPMYLSDADIFGEIHPGDGALLQKIAAELRHVAAAHPTAAAVAPLTVGHHVDHQLVRQAAEQVWGERLIYYEDYPYAAKPDQVAAVVAAAPITLAPVTVALREAALQRKTDAIAEFRSQLSTFFTDRADLDAQVRAYAAAVGGERGWRIVSLGEEMR